MARARSVGDETRNVDDAKSIIIDWKNDAQANTVIAQNRRLFRIMKSDDRHECPDVPGSITVLARCNDRELRVKTCCRVRSSQRRSGCRLKTRRRLCVTTCVPRTTLFYAMLFCFSRIRVTLRFEPPFFGFDTTFSECLS